MCMRANRYIAPSGKTYMFFSGQDTNVYDEKDAEFFAKGDIFKEIKTHDKIENKIVQAARYTREQLEKLEFKALKEIGKLFGTTDRSKEKIIDEILEKQDSDKTG